MSRIGKKPISLPRGVQLEVGRTSVTVKGPKGQLSQKVHPDITIAQDGDEVTLGRPTDQAHHRSLHGLTRALLHNMVVGVSEGYSRRLLIEGVGYRAEMKGNTLVLNVGYSHPVEMPPPPDVSFEVEDRGRTIIVNAIDKQVIGEMCARIRKVRPPEPYKGKGIRYADEYVRRKAGKAGKV